ncbi:MAG: DUF222 domain-containing protein [Candidatus Dormibacteraeota bacterium]|nr:DUF222 domain-containing protein [Candidatus Dormibacteraeota bacterium]
MSLPQDVTELAAHFHAAQAHVVDVLAELDSSREWEGVGFRTCAHWLSIHAGFGQYTAGAMLSVGRALRELPLIRQAFAEGRLSFDKVRALVNVATAADEQVWLDIALAASATQLAWICERFRRSTVVEDPARPERQRAERTFNAWWLDDGALRLVATLGPEEGRIVLNAVEEAIARGRISDENGKATDRPAYPAVDIFGARRSDALARVCEQWLAGAPHDNASQRAPRQLVVHVDLDTLVAKETDGRCHIDRGPAVPVAVAERIGCDSEVLTMFERGGSTLDLHRTRRAISGRLRRALQLRDGSCRYPGCRVPAIDCDGHHIVAWIDGGKTTLRNAISLCAFHHQRHHEGAFKIVGRDADRVEFQTPTGEFICPNTHPLPVHERGGRWLRQLSMLAGRTITTDTATALGRGGPFDRGLTIELLDEHVKRSRASPE